jgi:peroxiredoxin
VKIFKKEGIFMFKKICILIILFCLYSLSNIYAVECPSMGEPIPDIILSVPENLSEKNYLGIKEKTSFKISRINADVVILEIFSMYCPYCQKEAPLVNELYDIINKNQDIKDKIKIIGIGAGNTPFEVNVFKNQYNILFPLFSDESFSIHKSVGEVRTPYFFVYKINTDGSTKIIYSKVGSIRDPGQFLDFIIKESGIK